MARRVLILSHGIHVSGAERSAIALATSLDPQRYEALVGAPGEGPLLELARESGLPSIVVATRKASLKQPLRVASNMRALRRAFREHSIALVHANSFHAAKQAAPLTIVGGLVMVTSIRDIVPLTRPTLAALMRSRLVACVSNATRDHVRSLLPEPQHERVRTVYNGVDPGSMLPAAPLVRNEVLGASCGDELVVGMLAPLVRWKGQDLLLRAARRARAQQGADLRVVLAGGEQFCEPGYREELDELARAPELDGRVHFLGQRADVPELLASLDLVVCASTSPDPFTRAILEAMAAGRAVIGPDAGGVPEQIEQGVTGWLFPAGDDEALAARLIELSADDEARKRAGHAAAKKVARAFSLARHANAMQALYDEALNAD